VLHVGSRTLNDVPAAGTALGSGRTARDQASIFLSYAEISWEQVLSSFRSSSKLGERGRGGEGNPVDFV